MKNIPRIFLDTELKPGIQIPLLREVSHYLTHVMRTKNCLVFNDGIEFSAFVSDDGKFLNIGNKTTHTDPSGDITLFFAPIKKTDDMLNMATQLGVKQFVPVITERTVANHINWERMKKIVIEAAEQSNRNSVPKILAPIKFEQLPFSELVFADERAAYGADLPTTIKNTINILVGPEGGFSEKEFETLDKNGARGMSLGKTILRAELAAPIAMARITK